MKPSVVQTLLLCLTVQALSGTMGSAASADVKKITAPNAEEAEELHLASDRVVKTAPKDNAQESTLYESDKFKKPEPRVDSQKVDVPDSVTLGDEVVATADDKPVVVNDYDPNNLGVDSKKESKDDKKKGDRKSGKKTTEMKTETIDEFPGSSSRSSSDRKLEQTQSESSKAESSFHSFTMALSMILFSEVGDKTFLIAALMAMKHPRIIVFTASFASLVVMTMLSAFVGQALPSILPRKVTSFIAAILFIVFGAKLLREGLAMDSNLGVEEEMEEVEMEIEAKEMAIRNDGLERGDEKHDLRRVTSSPNVLDDGLELGGGEIPLYKMTNRRNHSPSIIESVKQFFDGLGNLAQLVISPIWVQVFVMTFLGELGDRSQMSTFILAAGSGWWGVVTGAVVGHFFCTLAAVLGGRFLATKISLKTMTVAGGVSFLLFAGIYGYEGVVN